MQQFTPSTSELGSLKATLNDSYNGQRCHFVANDVLVYACGPSLKLYNVRTHVKSEHKPAHLSVENGTNSICLLTANAAASSLAFSDTQPAPKIHILHYDAASERLGEQCKLTDGASIEYLHIDFTHDDVLLTLTGLPELTVIIWNTKSGEKTTSVALNQLLPLPLSIAFSPASWHNFYVSYADQIELYHMEVGDTSFIKTIRSRLLMPAVVGIDVLEQPSMAAAADESALVVQLHDEFEYPIGAVTSHDAKLDDFIEQTLDNRPRHKLVSSCWFGANGDELLILTAQSSIYKYSFNDASMKCIVEPSEGLENPVRMNRLYLSNSCIFVACSDGSVQVWAEPVVVAKRGGGGKGANNHPHPHPHPQHQQHQQQQQQSQQQQQQQLNEVHNAQLYKLRAIVETAASFVSYLSFNVDHSLVSISTSRGVQLLQLAAVLHAGLNGDKPDVLSLSLNERNERTGGALNEDKRFSLLLNYDYSATVSVASLAATHNESSGGGNMFLVLKENGTLQLWSLEQREMIQRFGLGERCSSMSTHPNLPLVVVGTSSGHLVFLDYTSPHSPRILEKCALHAKTVRFLKFNESGKLLFSVGDDKKLFVIDTRLSTAVESILTNLNQALVTNFTKPNVFQLGFYILGFTEFEGEPACFDTLDFFNTSLEPTGAGGEKPDKSTRVALGLHDTSVWEASKKTLQELPIFINSALEKSLSSSNASVNANNANHNLLVQCLQTQAEIGRLSYATSSYEADYDRSANPSTVKLASKVLIFDFNLAIFNDMKNVYASNMLNFRDETINKSTFNTQYLFSDCALVARNYLTAFTDRFLVKLAIPDQDANKKTNKSNMLELSEIFGTHDFGYGVLARALNDKFLLSAGFDGSLKIRTIADLRVFTETRASHFNNGGVQLACFAYDNLVAVGYDCTVSTFKWNFQLAAAANQGKSNGNAVVFSSMSAMKSNEKSNNVTWYEIKEKEFFQEQDKIFIPIRKEIASGIVVVKRKLKELMAVNQSMDSLAKLKEHEFYLDLEELERLQKEADTEVLRIREHTEMDNLAKMYVRENIKKECWDEMVVKGRGIQAFNTNLFVENYALRERSRDELEYLERVKKLRRIEMSAKKAYAELMNDVIRRENVGELVENDEEEASKESESQQQQANAASSNPTSYLFPSLINLAFKGSIGSLFNGDSAFFYNQFELFTREQKRMQIALIQDAVYRIKENFNKEFELVMQRKHQEIGRIKEKNQRLKQIYIDLNEEAMLAEPQFGDSENPELLFEVKDSEIKVEKYLTDEQRRLLEEQLAEEIKRRELEKLDNWRERGLIDMMGGVLQIRREDELKKDIPPPAFSLERPPEEWTQDEVKLYQIYEQKVKDLQEEREKLKKQLLAEINKINEQILDCYQNFDNHLLVLHQRKVKTQQAVYQEELKMTRMLNSLIVDTELETFEAQNSAKLEEAKERKKKVSQDIQHFKKLVESSKEKFDILSAEDKSQEKAFLREFADLTSVTKEHLLKLFKKRPKQKTNVNNEVIAPLTAAEADAGLVELDRYENAPDGIDHSIWDRFVAFRRQKIALENSIRAKGAHISEMSMFYQNRVEEEEQARKQIDELNKVLLNIQDLRLRTCHNLQIQLLMKQGQVEINPGAYVHNFESCLLIHRSVVESLNKVIKTFGKQKIAIMVDCKDFRKGIRQLEWEHRKMKMTIEDYIQKQRDITYLKLSKEVQEYLTLEDFDGKKQKEASVLEQTISYKTKQYEKIYNQKLKQTKDIRMESVKLGNLNQQLDDQLTQKNVVLHDRKHINEEINAKEKDMMREEKLLQIMQRRKLVDLAKAQAQEVAFLRAEVERLRMKTFPALVQVDY